MHSPQCSGTGTCCILVMHSTWGCWLSTYQKGAIPTNNPKKYPCKPLSHPERTTTASSFNLPILDILVHGLTMTISNRRGSPDYCIFLSVCIFLIMHKPFAQHTIHILSGLFITYCSFTSFAKSGPLNFWIFLSDQRNQSVSCFACYYSINYFTGTLQTLLVTRIFIPTVGWSTVTQITRIKIQ